MIEQILQTSALVCFLVCIAFELHKKYWPNPPDFLKVVEVLVMLGGATVFFVTLFFWIWNK